jgi:thioredoxin reductase
MAPQLIHGSFHCLYCHGWEERDAASSGILCEGDISSVVLALFVARQALRLSKEVTMYTHGNAQLAEDIKSTVAPALQAKMKADPRVIKKFTKGPRDSEVILHFEDGTTKTEGFLAHKPKGAQRSPFAEQLGLEMSPQGTIKVNPPFNQTSMKGVFAAGDASNPMQTITQAIFSGTACGGGAPLQLQAETYDQKNIF